MDLISLFSIALPLFFVIIPFLMILKLISEVGSTGPRDRTPKIDHCLICGEKMFKVRVTSHLRDLDEVLHSSSRYGKDKYNEYGELSDTSDWFRIRYWCYKGHP